MQPLKPRTIFWDWDGTLVDSFETIRQAYNAARSAFGLSSWSLEEAHANVAKSGRDTFPAMFGENAAAASDIFYSTYNRLAPELVKAKPGRAQLLRDLIDAGMMMAVVSNKRGDILRAEVKALGWEGYFVALVGSGDAATDKPSLAPMQLAASNAGVRLTADIPYIGDAPIDAEAAKIAGLSAVLLAGETHSREALSLAGEGVRVVNFRELPHLLIGKA
ncbi:MAG: HAD hydrolase-like protein [Proteobacteria bacterium]|nr:HAD hydrolase-like protein [Pseudomonadota bacterium]